MSARSIRRAAARQANKAAEPTAQNNISNAQLAANRANAKSSTGPKSEQGKLTSSHNALKTGLTGRTVWIEEEDAPRYRKLAADFIQDLQPIGPQETALVAIRY